MKWNYEFVRVLLKNPVSWSLTFIVEWHATNYYHFIISIVSTILIIMIIIIFLILFLLIIHYFNCFNYFNHYNYFDFYNYLNYFHHSIRLINYISNNQFINQTKTLAPLSAGGHFLNYKLAWYMLTVGCYLLLATCYLLLVICYLLLATCY